MSTQSPFIIGPAEGETFGATRGELPMSAGFDEDQFEERAFAEAERDGSLQGWGKPAEVASESPYEIDPYADIRPALRHEHAALAPGEITVTLGRQPAALALHHMLTSPKPQQAVLAVLLGDAGLRSIRLSGSDVAIPAYLRLLSRLCREVAEQHEAADEAAFVPQGALSEAELEVRRPVAIGSGSFACGDELSASGLAWRADDIRRGRKPRPQIIRGKPFCPGMTHPVRIGPRKNGVDVLLWNFDIDGSYLKRQHEAELDQVIAALHANLRGRAPTAASYSIKLSGFASRTGNATYNAVLASEREDAVKAYLLANMEKYTGVGEAPIGPLVTIGPHHDGFYPKAPEKQEDAESRSARVIALPAGMPIPPPRPFPTDVQLRALLTASMLLTADRAAPFTSGSLPFARQSGSIWEYRLSLRNGALAADAITCVIPHPGGSAHPMTVLDEAKWDGVELTLASGQRAALPLDQQFLLGSFSSSTGSIAARSHPIWRLASQIDVGTAAVFAYDITNPANPQPVSDVAVLTPSRPGTTPSRLWALVCCELVLCKARNDFEPMGVLDAARIYPLIQILTNAETTATNGTVMLRRPASSAMDHGWAGGGHHLVGLFVDRNSGMGLMEKWAALVGASGVAVPTWEDIFDYVLKNGAASSQRLVVVDRAKTTPRSDTTHRSTLDRLREANVASTVLKMPRQGAFDNIHVAPQMEISLSIPVVGSVIPSTAVSMAPICAHDCFHIHWRWSLQYTGESTLGWGPSGPYTQPGAPMVHPNQTVTVALDAGVSGFRYEAVAASHPANDWMVVMPHGAAYAVRLRISAAELVEKIPGFSRFPAPVRAAIKADIAGREDRAFAWFYFFLQFWPALQSKPWLRPLDVITADLPFLTVL
jgi:hypothetical protein